MPSQYAQHVCREFSGDFPETKLKTSDRGNPPQWGVTPPLNSPLHIPGVAAGVIINYGWNSKWDSFSHTRTSPKPTATRSPHFTRVRIAGLSLRRGKPPPAPDTTQRRQHFGPLGPRAAGAVGSQYRRQAEGNCPMAVDACWGATLRWPACPRGPRGCSPATWAAFPCALPRRCRSRWRWPPSGVRWAPRPRRGHRRDGRGWQPRR